MLKGIKYVYFLGIGGIGMSALARWFHAKNFYVAGYDKTATPLTSQLQQEDIEITFQDSLEDIPQIFKEKQKTETLIIYTPAITKTHPQLQFFQKENYVIKKRAEVLGLITQDYFTVAVAGTHGKTSTSSLLAHILKSAKLPSTGFLGGILQNYESNLLLNDFPEKQETVVVEADEFDRSFLHLSPNISIILSTDADHLDIYGDDSQIKESYSLFAKKIPEDGVLFLKKGVKETLEIPKETNVVEYSLDNSTEIYSDNIQKNPQSFVFDWHWKEDEIKSLELFVPGFHNVENATVAIAVAQKLGISANAIREALKSYKGVKRRFEYIVQNENFVFVDDYAHHPTEIEAFLTSLKAIYHPKKITAVFQPHLYSRTRDFQEGFAQSLSLADELILLDIYPAREEAIPGITSEIILNQVNLSDKILCSKEELLQLAQNRDFEIIATIGAGDIALLLPSLKEIFLSKN